MQKLLSVLVIAVVFSALAVLNAFGVPALISCDFSSGKEIHRVKVGSFDGPLPDACGENFTGWMKDGKVKTSIVDEDGAHFTRFVTHGKAQFRFATFDMTGPCYYRVTIKARSISEPIHFFLRQAGAPYREYWSTDFVSPEWSEKTYMVHVGKMDTQRCSVFFETYEGECDIASVRVESVTESDYAASVRRPPAEVKQFFRHTRFPFGLPNSWNRMRETLEGEFSSEGEVLKVVSPVPQKGIEPELCGFWTEPIQTNEPDKPVTVSFEYRSEGNWQVWAKHDNGKALAGKPIAEASDWKTMNFVVQEPLICPAFALRFNGNGVFRLRRIRAWAGNDEPPADRSAEVALAPGAGEIAEATRIHFVEERPVVRFKAMGDFEGGVLKATVTDLYGKTSPLKPVKLNVDGTGTLDYGVFPARPLGQFRIDAYVEKNGRAVSPVEELVMTRIQRPIAWGRDAPDSPFGGHIIACESMITMMKAAGMNWTRFHDVGIEYCGWALLEPVRGQWHWRDREIKRYRDQKMKIFSQLGTAPSWATHYGDLGCRSMSYFNRYLRPTNNVDTVNYVKKFVSRYKGVIDDYFVWNEPWGSWWSRAADIKYYDGAKAGSDYAAFSKVVYNAAKEANPGATVCGYNTFIGTTGNRWTKSVHEGGAFDFCDAMDFHYYTSQRRCRVGRDERIVDNSFAAVREQYPEYGGKPIYMTEGGSFGAGKAPVVERFSGLYSRSVPWEPETSAAMAQTADCENRFVISLLAEGVKRLFLYSGNYTSLAIPCYTARLIAADGFPYATMVSFSHLARMLEGKRFVRLETRGPESGVYVFEGSGGVVKIYSGLSDEEACALKGAKDLYGNSVTRETYMPETLVYVESKNRK